MENLNEQLNDINGHATSQEVLKFIYIIKVWEKLSDEEIDSEDLKFNNFYYQKIEVKKLEDIFNKLSQKIRLFKLYHFNSKLFNNEDLTTLIRVAKNISTLPKINSAFYSTKSSDNYSVAEQIAKLGVKLLDIKDDEVYIPFTTGFAYSEFLNMKIFAENQNYNNLIFAELINILEDKDIDLHITNSLDNPTFINSNAPHLLKEFNYLLSFPPSGLKGNFDASKDKFHRFNIHKGRILDVAHFEHILAQTKFKAVVLMPVGLSYRGGSEENLRKYLIDNNYLEAIIQLPPNLHSVTSVQTLFFVINKLKDNNKVEFINLVNDDFIVKDGRSLILKDVDEIVQIYKSRKEIEGVSVLISNSEIVNNKYSLAIDRYVVSKESYLVQKSLNKFKLVKLDKIANIRRSQLFKDDGKGQTIYEVSPSDFSNAGFTLECGKSKNIALQDKRLQTYKLEPYDILLSTKGTIGKVAIIGDIKSSMMASQASQVIRLVGDDKRERAICLYMFFKSNLAQNILNSLTAGAVMPQVSTFDIKNLEVPIFKKKQEKQLILNFEKEIELYSDISKIITKIDSIHSSFLN